MKKFAPSHALNEALARMICGSNLGGTLCSNVQFMIMGYHKENLNKTRLPVILSHYPDGTSTKNILHYIQVSELLVHTTNLQLN